MRCIYCIVGPSGSGKSTLASQLTLKRRMTPVVSRTTRPPRYPNEPGHIFTDEKWFQDQRHNLAAYTKYDGYHYGVTFEELSRCDLYVIDPAGLLTLRQRCKKKLRVIWLDISERAAKGRMLARGDDEQQALRRIREDQERFSPAMKALVQPDLTLLSDIFPPEAIYNIVLKFIGENEYWSWKYV